MSWLSMLRIVNSEKWNPFQHFRSIWPVLFLLCLRFFMLGVAIGSLVICLWTGAEWASPQPDSSGWLRRLQVEWLILSSLFLCLSRWCLLAPIPGLNTLEAHSLSLSGMFSFIVCQSVQGTAWFCRWSDSKAKQSQNQFLAW